MSDGISSIASAQGVTASSPVAPASAAQAAQSYASVAASASSTAVTPLDNTRTVIDPAAGFITQYLSANGSQVVSQTPSAITVAYLRIGLTADGLSKEPATPAHVATSA